MDTTTWIERLLFLAKGRGAKVETAFQRKFLAEWIRDDCLTRGYPSDEIEGELERRGLHK